jgi:hypothetical protein
LDISTDHPGDPHSEAAVQTPPPKIFLSYRHDDTPGPDRGGHAGRLYGELARHFSAENVFMDIEAIEPGVPWQEAIDAYIPDCDVLLVLIGKEWLTITDEGRRRLDDPHDVHRREIETALERKLRVIPICVEDAQPLDPEDEELPPSLKPLAERQAVELTHRYWRYNVADLVERLQRVAAQKEARRRAKAEAAQEKAGDEARKQGEAPAKAKQEAKAKREAAAKAKHELKAKAKREREAEQKRVDENLRIEAAYHQRLEDANEAGDVAGTSKAELATKAATSAVVASPADRRPLFERFNAWFEESARSHFGTSPRDTFRELRRLELELAGNTLPRSFEVTARQSLKLVGEVIVHTEQIRLGRSRRGWVFLTDRDSGSFSVGPRIVVFRESRLSGKPVFVFGPHIDAAQELRIIYEPGRPLFELHLKFGVSTPPLFGSWHFVRGLLMHRGLGNTPVVAQDSSSQHLQRLQ